MELAVLSLSFLLFLVLGVPVAFAIGLSCLAAFAVEGLPLATAMQMMVSGMNVFSFLAIPFFIFSGELMLHGGIADKILDFARSLVGHWKGGLGLANVMASTLVVTAENVRELALDAFDNFARLERANRAALMKVDPKIHQAAETVRRDGKKYLDALTAAKVAFQNDRSQANATALTSALASVQSLLRDTVRYISEIATKKGTP